MLYTKSVYFVHLFLYFLQPLGPGYDHSIDLLIEIWDHLLHGWFTFCQYGSLTFPFWSTLLTTTLLDTKIAGDFQISSSKILLSSENIQNLSYIYHKNE